MALEESSSGSYTDPNSMFDWSGVFTYLGSDTPIMLSFYAIKENRLRGMGENSNGEFKLKMLKKEDGIVEIFQNYEDSAYNVHYIGKSSDDEEEIEGSWTIGDAKGKFKIIKDRD